MPRRKSATRRFEDLLRRHKSDKYVLKLFVAGASPKSLRAIEEIKRVCEEHLSGRYELEVIDVYQQPGLVVGEQIVAAPTLLKKLPEPMRRLVGDFSNEAKVLLGLDLSEDV
jgi:circadian clock protein KaiB